MRDRYDGPQIDLILRAAEGRVSKDRGRSLRCWAYVSADARRRGPNGHRGNYIARSVVPRLRGGRHRFPPARERPRASLLARVTPDAVPVGAGRVGDAAVGLVE